MIKISNLVKKYQKNEILNIKDFQFNKGKSYIIVGSNGSGKSTLIKCLLGINKINSGSIYLNSKNIGYVPERFYFPDFCTIEKFLINISELYNVYENHHLIGYYCDLFNLNKKKLLSKLSKGMMQKVIIIQSLIHNSDLFIMDEPLNGLDFKSQNIFFEIIEEIKKENKTIIIATHYPQFYINSYDYRLKIENKNIIYEDS